MSFEDKIALRELVDLYAYYFDEGMVEQWASLFTENTYFDERAFGLGLHIGAEGVLAAGYEETGYSKHVVHLICTHVVRDLTATTAKGTVFALVDALSNSGYYARYQVKYEDEYAKIGSSWKFSRRVLIKTFPVEVLVDVGSQTT